MSTSEFRSSKLANFAIVAVFIGTIGAMVAMLARENMRQKAGDWPKGHRKDNMENLAAALEAYRADAGTYPPMVPIRDFVINEKLVRATKGWDQLTVSPRLTTPVAYIDAIPGDPHAPQWNMPFVYHTDGEGWILISAGRDHLYSIQTPSELYSSKHTAPSAELLHHTYDPSNGKKSSGDIWMVQQGFEEGLFSKR